jgi:hypothetical protein
MIRTRTAWSTSPPTRPGFPRGLRRADHAPRDRGPGPRRRPEPDRQGPPASPATIGATRSPRRPFDWRDDRGQVGGVEVLPFSILIFVVGSLLVLNAWAVVDVKFAVDAATREAVRAFVEAPDEATATRRADRAAREAITGHGRDGAKLTVSPVDYGDGGSFARCAPVTIRASYPVPALSLPWLGRHGDAFRVSSSHTEVVDPYRSGLRASGSCR